MLGSFHSALRETADQTDRYLAALRNPDLHILGHPRGRMYGRRVGLTADWKRVFAEAARLPFRRSPPLKWIMLTRCEDGW